MTFIKLFFLYLLVWNDDELEELLRRVFVPAAGTVPMIHSVLLHKSKKRKAGRAHKQEEVLDEGEDGEDETDFL